MIRQLVFCACIGGLLMGKHPEAPTRVATLLKRQKGKCAYCGLFFQDGNLMEIDHKVPRSKGGKDSYDNLQLRERTLPRC
jgi:RNA-directed DNA polymerase